MLYQCPICFQDPTSHSLKKVHETDQVVYYYTCPAKASKFSDRAGIVAHYDGELSAKGDKKWVWIFDSTGFDIRHAMEVTIAIDIATLVNDKFGHSLEKICVTNQTMFANIILGVVTPFLSSRLRSMIVYELPELDDHIVRTHVA